jgi:hypothetical protein
VRSGRAATAEKNPPLTAAVAATDPQATPGGPAGRPEDGTGESTDLPAGTDEDGAPMVMDLPETPGHTGGAQRSRNAKPGKPQRPKFLNTRE